MKKIKKIVLIFLVLLILDTLLIKYYQSIPIYKRDRYYDLEFKKIEQQNNLEFYDLLRDIHNIEYKSKEIERLELELERKNIDIKQKDVLLEFYNKEKSKV